MHASLFIWKYAHFAHRVVSYPFKTGFLSMVFWNKVVVFVSKWRAAYKEENIFFLKEKSVLLDNLNLFSPWCTRTKQVVGVYVY